MKAILRPRLRSLDLVEAQKVEDVLVLAGVDESRIKMQPTSQNALGDYNEKSRGEGPYLNVEAEVRDPQQFYKVALTVMEHSILDSIPPVDVTLLYLVMPIKIPGETK